MLFFSFCLLWLMTALGIGYMISFADRMKNVIRLGMVLILVSFSVGLIMMAHAIYTLY